MVFWLPWLLLGLAFASGDPGQLLVLVWFASGLWGAISLWVAAVGPNPVSRATFLGLIAGALAMLPMVSLVSADSGDGSGSIPAVPASFEISEFVMPMMFLWATLAPLMIALWHIYEYLRTGRSGDFHAS